MKSPIVVLLFLLFWGMSCSDNPADSKSSNNAPADHTVSKGGVKHKSGLNSPAANCVACHGSDLKGGTSGVSCFSCHGKKW